MLQIRSVWYGLVWHCIWIVHPHRKFAFLKHPRWLSTSVLFINKSVLDNITCQWMSHCMNLLIKDQIQNNFKCLFIRGRIVPCLMGPCESQAWPIREFARSKRIEISISSYYHWYKCNLYVYLSMQNCKIFFQISTSLWQIQRCDI